MSERLTEAEVEALEARLRSAQWSLAHLKEDLDTLTGLFAPQVEADALRRENERLRAAIAEFRAAALAEEAETGDDEAHRRARDRYMAAKRKMVEAGESSSEGP